MSGSAAAVHPYVLDMARALREAGGRAYLVGGWVRDLVALAQAGGGGSPPADEYDLEVYGLPAERVAATLGRFGSVRLVGESFAVYKVVGTPAPGMTLPAVDVSLPRRDTKIARGHRGFQVTGDPDLPVAEAARRRDFTINAMLHDPLTGETIDPWGGAEDLKARILRAVDPGTFVEDSLRVLRGVQFAARLEFEIEPDTVLLCRSVPLDDLPAERVWGEVEKLLLKAARPSAGLAWADRLDVVARLFPELETLKGCPQEPEWHPEGDVWTHTLQAIDIAADESRDLPREKRLAVLLAVLCHDFGKPSTTQIVDGRIRSFEHEEAGIEPTRAFLDRLKVHSLGGYDLRHQVIQLVAHHLTPSHYYKNRENVGDGAFRRLARKLEPELLYVVSRADSLGRSPGVFATEAQEWFISRVRSLGVEVRPPKPILQGRHLLDLGLRPGPEIGRITKAVYEMQLDGRVVDLEGALDQARRLVGEAGSR